jgi:hypothetical protein
MYKPISTIFIVMILTILAISTASAATPLPAPRHIFLNVSNDAGVKFDWDGATYDGPANTYYTKADGGGLNELHVTNDLASPSGQVTATVSSTTSPSGVIYFTNTGGRGFDNDIILLASVKGPIPDNFALHIRSSGYNWTPAPGGAYQPTLDISQIDYLAGALDEVFTKEDFLYGPQTWKPGPGDLVTPSLPLYYGQDISNASTQEYLMFIDLNAGNIYPSKFPGSTLIDEGAVKVEFWFSNMTTHASFNGYGWCSAANQGQGISWTNQPGGATASGYSITCQASSLMADFTANTTSGDVPLTVHFTDLSTNAPISWAWTFGDGGTSTEQNPSHTYTAAGTYTVTLTATNAEGSDDEVKTGYITVTPGVLTLPGQVNAPTDPDGDGKYEDLSGNGAAGFADVVLFFKHIEWIAANEPIVAFDFSGNGGIGFQDIVVLFKELP